MATGGIEIDNRTTCSVCLEPFRGRGVKILPCFHTFCIPCLSGLVERTGDTSQTSDTPGLDGEEGEGGSADRLTCPTCRRVVPVPAGGVTAFQTNFYVDSSGGEEDVQPVPCTVCDRGQTVQFHCGQCQNNFCSLCQRSHDKFCRGSQVRSLQDPPDSSSSSSSTAQSPSHCQVRLQLQKVEDALKKLTEEKRKLNQEREAMDDSISVRYATLLRHAADARVTCCLSLREVCDGLMERLDSSMAEARQTRDTLQQQLSSSQPAPMSASQLRAALFMEGELPMILNRDLGSSSLLQHHMEENTSLMIDALQSFMGKVVRSNPSSGPAQNKAPSGSSPSFQDGRGAVSSTEAANPRNLQDLYEKLEDVAGQVTSLQSQLSTTNSKLSTEQSTLQREVTSLRNKNVQLTTEQAGLQREVTAMRDKHAIVQQDLAVLTAEKDKVSAELAKLQREVTSMQTDTPSAMLQTDTPSAMLQTDTPSAMLQTDTPSAMLQTDIRQLKADHENVTAKLSSVQADVTAIQGDNDNMKKDVTAIQADTNDMKKDITALQGDNSKMRKAVTALQGDNDKMKKDVTALQGDNNNMKKDVTALQGDTNDMKKDITALQGDNSKMRKAVTALQGDNDKMKKDVTALQGDNNNMKKDVTALQGDNNNMKKDVTALQGDNSKMKKDVTALQGDNNKMKKDVTALQGDNDNMKKDVTALQGDNNKMKKDSDQVKTDVTNTQGKLSRLESRFVTANTQVGFSAWMSEDVTTNKVQQTLVCDDIFSNEGGGYDAQTGEFTAPVTGTYCFLATTSPDQSDVEKEARLDIVIDGELVGDVLSEGRSWSTGHIVVKVTSGQKVWLRSYDEEEYMFAGGWTQFSGMLLQAEV